LAWGAQSYIKKMLSNYIQLFGEPPKEFSSPMEENDHPELDLSPEHDLDGIQVYQSRIVALQGLLPLVVLTSSWVLLRYYHGKIPCCTMSRTS
jgi:hypothetical protein